MTTNPIIAPVVIPEDAAPIQEGSQLEETGILVHSDSLQELEHKNIFINFTDKTFAVGRFEIHNLQRGLFTIGTDSKVHNFSNVASFRVVWKLFLISITAPWTSVSEFSFF